MARRPNAKKEAKAAAQDVIDALKFVSVAQSDIGLVSHTHCRIGGGYVVASNGVVAAGCKLVQELTACPHTLNLLRALQACPESVSLAMTDAGRLSVRSGAFRSLVACAEPDAVPVIGPDSPCAVVDERLTRALALASPIAAENASSVIPASVLLHAGSAFATNREFLIEAWHGIDLPPGLILPKSGVTALLKLERKPVRFGWTPDTSVTFYFEDDSWFKTQLYRETWPNAHSVLNVQTNPFPVDAAFFHNAKVVAQFDPQDSVFIRDNLLSTVDDETSYQMVGLVGGPGTLVAGKYIGMLSEYVTSMDLIGDERAIFFFGNNVRGAIAKKRLG